MAITAIDFQKEIMVGGDDWGAAYAGLKSVVDAPAEFKIVALARFAARLREHYIGIGRELERDQKLKATC